MAKDNIGRFVIALGIVTAGTVPIIGYFPPFGLSPLISSNGFFLPFIITLIAPVIAVVGACIAAHEVVRNESQPFRTITTCVAIPASVAITISAYLVIFVGIRPLSPPVVLSIGIAILFGLVKKGS